MNRQLITGGNFAKNSNFVFSQEITFGDFKNLNSDNLFIVSKNQDYVCYINRNLKIEENDMVFCKTDYVNLLFKYLKKVENLKNIKLITSQSDLPINKKLFSRKPNCISKWYSTNVQYSNENLISIPLGLANEFSKKNLNQFDFNDFTSFEDLNNKENKIYVNFNVNTNYLYRSKLISKIKKDRLFVITNNTLSLKEYKNNLSKYKFVLCPPGNGVDTHRIWETLYSNSIPIIFDEFYLDYFKELPIIAINKVEEVVNIDFNTNKLAINQDVFFLKWWLKLIQEKTIDSNNSINIEILNHDVVRYFNLIKFKIKYLKLIKKIKTISTKFYRKIKFENL